jgi:hypothetical protein
MAPEGIRIEDGLASGRGVLGPSPAEDDLSVS